MKYINFFTVFLISSLCWGHARLISPVPRNNNAGIKNGPCGGLSRSANPTVVQGGSTMTFQWEETINHPGRYIFSLSTANDLNFNQNVLATIVDQQDAGVALPHRYTAQITIPNINCPTCTIQLIQSMEENPAAPTYYYSCADINIQMTGAPTPTPSPPSGGGEVVQSSSLPPQASAVKFGQGCGTVKAVATPQANLSWLLTCLLTMLVPIIVWTKLRAVSIPSKN